MNIGVEMNERKRNFHDIFVYIGAFKNQMQMMGGREKAIDQVTVQETT